MFTAEDDTHIKRGEVMINEMLLATQLLDNCWDSQLDKPIPVAKIRAMYPEVFIVAQKAKAEVYPHVKAVRSIFPPESFATLPASLFLNFMFDTNINVVSDSSDPEFKQQTQENRNLLGVKLFHGGMHKLVEYMINRAHEGKVGFYSFSDNAYLLCPLHTKDAKSRWAIISMDGVKYESSICVDDVKSFFSYLVELATGLFKTTIDKKLRYYLTEVYPVVMCQSYSIFGKQVLEKDSMYSGMVGTASAILLRV
jgi:hypothetical protein